jgi:SAM-dependent methyltransferase
MVEMPTVPTARYDGQADFYDALFAHYQGSVGSPGAVLSALLGPVSGQCLDVGCGTGLSGLALATAGWRVGGLDVSSDQLRLAKPRLAWVVRGDARALPFASGSVDCAAGMFVHTDVDDFGALVLEVARVLRPGGRFAYLGVHPCFVGPHIEGATTDEEELHVFRGYRRAEWIQAWEFRSERFRSSGLRQQVGARHVPLANLLGAFTMSGLILDTISEHGEAVVPWMLGLGAQKPE